MSNQSGVQLYTQSMNGLITIDNADTIQVFELDAEIINVDDLTVNNLLTTPQISNTTIGTIIQTGSNIITQTGTGTNILKNTNFNGDVEIDGNLILTGILEYDILDVDCENLIVQNDSTLNDVNISGDLRVDNVLQTYDYSIKEDYVYGFTQVTETTGIQVLSFQVQPNLSGTFTIGYISPLSIKESGLRSFTNQTTTTSINSCIANLYKNGVLYDSNNASSSNGFSVIQSFTIGADPIPPLNPYNYQKYITVLSSSFTINHTSSSITTNYFIELVINYNRTNVWSGSTVYNLILNTTFSGYTQSSVIAYSPAVIGNYQATNYTLETISISSTDTGSILCNEINSNIFNGQELDISNVLQAYPFKNTGITNTINYSQTGLFVGSQTEILSFSDIPSNGYNATITLKCPLSLYESGNYASPSTITSTGSSISSVSFYLYQNGNLILTQTGTFSNPGFFNWSFSLGVYGVYTYNRFTHTAYATLNFSIPPSSTGSTYSLKMNMVNTRNNAVTGSTYGYIANTTNSGNNYTGVITPNTYSPLTPYEAPSYLFTFTDYIPPYTTDTGYLVNNILVNNDIYNQNSITSTNITTDSLYKKAEFYNINFVSGATLTLTTNYSFYLYGREGNIQCNLPYLSNNYRGFSVWLRKAVPSRNSDYIVINCSVNGVTFYEKNMTAITTDKTFINEVAFHLLYAGNGIWYSLNHH